MTKKVLMLLKRKEDYSEIKDSPKGLSTGLYNSASFIQLDLLSSGVDIELEVCIDANDIDRLVTEHRPDVVVLEALWVVPSKFSELTALHPGVEWIVRLHSEMPFMAGEGMAMDWIADYVTYPEVSIAANAPRMLWEVRNYLSIKNDWDENVAAQRVVYLPNHYPKNMVRKEFLYTKDHIDIACFGAIRPLKNHLEQAFGALDFCDRIGKKLHFHVNADRIEMQGDPVARNLQDLFTQLSDTGHKLISHTWRDRKDFLDLCQEMDIGLQVSFSETFNIVGADLISQGVPLVGSSEIPWSSSFFNASPTESKSISRMLERAYNFPQINVSLNKRGLLKYVDKTNNIWLKFLEKN